MIPAAVVNLSNVVSADGYDWRRKDHNISSDYPLNLRHQRSILFRQKAKVMKFQALNGGNMCGI